MKTNSLLAFALATLTLAAACQKNAPGPEGNQEISFRLANSPVTVNTKADAVTTLSSFGVTATAIAGNGAEAAVWENVTFSGWEIFTGGKLWPETDPGYRFYASNSTISLVQGEAVLKTGNEKDVVVAYLPNPAYKTVNNINFQHIFARLRNVSVTADPGYTLSDVSITLKPKIRGDYYISHGFGQNDGTGWVNVQDGEEQELTGTTGGNKLLDLYVVPGEYVLSATWTATKGNFSVTHSNKRYVASLVGGKENNLSITLFGEESDEDSAHFRVSLEQWDDTDATARFTPDVFNGHDYVDLGVRDSEGRKVLFGTRNVGAEKESDLGDHLPWGETAIRYTPVDGGASFTDATFDWKTYVFTTENNLKITKYCTRADHSADGYVDGLTILCDTDDAASVQWGGKWQTPDPEHLQLLALSGVVEHEWTDNYKNTNVPGRIFRGKGAFANASIFLPAAGHFGATSPYSVKKSGEYWSRELVSEWPAKAIYMNFSSTSISVSADGMERYQPRSIRPVIVIAE